MTGGRFHGRCAADGTKEEEEEEKPRPISRFPATLLPEIDLLSQAKKALCERSPYDAAEDASTVATSAASPASGGGGGVVPTATLPRGLASFLSRQTDNRRRHKKSHSLSDKKSSRHGGEKSKGYNVWAETEEYFRALTLPDIEALAEVSELRSLAASKCFSTPSKGNIPEPSVKPVSYEECDKLNRVKEETVNEVVVDGGIAEEKFVANANVEDVGGNENGVVEAEVKTERNGEVMEIDSVGTSGVLEEEKTSCSVLDNRRGIEWILGYRNKIYLVSEKPSKKRKVLGADGGLVKVLNGTPCDGNPSLCHFCCTGDTGDESNRLIVCTSCKVVVHQKCYGVLDDDVDASWLCSWCKHKSDVGTAENPCVLCSKQGGALKLVLKSDDSSGPLVFAHLFCCQWMPEVYIEDVAKMGPIVNVGGIPEARRKQTCNICKVKWGACVRCSHAACRTSFHPLCAREARQRVEIWAKYGHNHVELKAFCIKHSEIRDNSNTESDPSVTVDKNLNSNLSTNKLNKSRTGGRKGNNLKKLGCGGKQQMKDGGKLKRRCEDANAPVSLNLAPILKKLIDCGKVDVKDVAKEIGLSPDSLSASLDDDSLVPDVQCRIVKWLKDHTYLDLMQKNVKTKLRPSFASIPEFGGSDAALLSESDITDTVAVKSVPPRRRTKGGLSKDKKVHSPSEETFCDKGITPDKIKVDEASLLKEDYIHNTVEKTSTVRNGLQQSLLTHSPEAEGGSPKPSNCSPLRSVQDVVATPLQSNSVIALVDLSSSVAEPVPESNKPEKVDPSSPVLPDLQKKISQMQNGVLADNTIHGSIDGEVSRVEASSHASVCCNHHSIYPKSCDTICNSDEIDLRQLEKARELGILEMSPEDELEGELIYYQHKLQNNANLRKHFTDNLMYNVAKSLPKEIVAVRNQKWDAVLVNQYLCELREAKKQGRKERRHKEAQAVLAAATAAAAASSRISSFRKDALDEPAHQENAVKLSSLSGRSSFSSQMIPRTKEAFPRAAVPRVSLEKHSGAAHFGSDISKEHSRSCDICRRSETMLNPILVCPSCKVAVHLDCYRGVRESTGPWYCELCEGKTAANFWEKENCSVECGLCGGKGGAFRKSSDGQWIHAFCAEWIFDSTFKRGQVNPIDGMDSVAKGTDFCYICRRKCGVCIKCNYGHCQSTFHPYCGRSSDFYMTVKTLGGKQQHKAYCERHSVEQRAKADTQKHGMEELKNLYTIRAELERLRLICERIIKREKVKRDLLICSHDILTVKRDHVARSVLVNSPFLPPDASSESATTSLKAPDDYRSCSETLQRSDDGTVDSSVSVKHRTRVPITIDNDQRTDEDSSASQNQFTQNLTERMQFSEKQIPFRSNNANCNLLEDGGYRSKSRKLAEMFSKELVMTSDQASVKNMLLPKGYAYVPADCIPNEKQMNPDATSGEQPEGDG